MTTTDQSLVASLARAQANFGTISKGHENKHFNSSYADVADVLEVVRPTLAAEGIAVVQPVRITADGCELVTALLKGDERMESTFPMPDNLAPQATLSWLTYMRRGLLCSLVGVHPAGEDDDGNEAQASGTTNVWKGGTRFPPKPISAGQLRFAGTLLKEVVHQNLTASYIEEKAGRNVPLEDLTTAEATQLIDALKEDRKQGRTADGDLPAGEPW